MGNKRRRSDRRKKKKKKKNSCGREAPSVTVLRDDGLKKWYFSWSMKDKREEAYTGRKQQQVESSWGRKHKSTWWGNRQKVSESGRQGGEKTQTERQAKAGQARALGIWRFSHTRQLEPHNLRGLLQKENLELLVKKKKNRGKCSLKY